MRQHGDVRIADRANDPARHFRLRQIEGRMHRCDDVIETSQRFIVEIERAVAQDVAFDTGKEAKIFEPAI